MNMSLLLDSFWRAVFYCLHPRVIALSFLPLIIMSVVSLGLGYLYWNEAVDMLRMQLENYQLVTSMSVWLEGLGLGNLRMVLAPALLLFMAIPVVVIVSLLFVAVLMTPAMVSLVGQRRFAGLERRQGGSLGASVLWSLPVAIWIYTLVFAFSSLWFAHYALSALQQLRVRDVAFAGPAPIAPAATVPSSTASASLPPSS
jgi:hypothetical protein